MNKAELQAAINNLENAATSIVAALAEAKNVDLTAEVNAINSIAASLNNAINPPA